MHKAKLGLSLLAAGALALGTLPSAATAAPGDEIAAAVNGGVVVDLTVTVSEDYPAHWPYHPPFKRWIMTGNPREGAGGAGDTVREDLVQSVFPYFSQQYVIDDHTGTQADFPAQTCRSKVKWAG